MGVVEVSSERVDVRISRRVLWIDSNAYPLHNIARAQTIRITPRHETPMKDYKRAAVIWLIVGGALTILLAATGVRGSALIVLIWIVILILLAMRTIRLFRELREKTFFALVIETAGTSRTALVSTDEDLMSELVYQIMDAIDNPKAEYQVQIENFHIGDRIHQVGDHNTGKMNLGT